jgi:hypothetical protein
MKKNILTLSILSASLLGITACSNNSGTSVEEHIGLFTADYVYDVSSNILANCRAKLLIEQSYLREGFSVIEVPKNTIAGDCLIVHYTGTITMLAIYPSILELNGEVLSYSFEQTEIHHIHADEGYITADSFDASYTLDDTHIIKNDSLEYEFLEGSKYTDVWYTTQWSDAAYAISSGKPINRHISGLYAFDPSVLR